MENEKNQSNKILKILLSLLIFLISIQYIAKIYQPTLLDDEFAYFGIAKYFTGINWSSTMYFCKYYSYGYSLLIAPFALFIKDTVLLYRMVVALNGFFLIAAFWLIDSIFRQLFSETNFADKKKWKNNAIAILSFMMLMLPCNINYASVALSECLLLLLFAIIMKIIMNLKANTGCMYYMVLGILLMYSYMVHQRMLGVMIAATIVLLIRFIKKQTNGKQLCSYLIAIVVLYIVHIFIKADIKDNLWLNGLYSGQNDMSGILENIKQIFSSFESFVKFIVSILGKLFYMGSSTYLFGFVGLFLAIFVLKKKLGTEKFTSNNAGLLFLILSFIMLLGISSVFMNEPTNMAYLLYGRYLETFSPFLMGFGILTILQLKEDYKHYIYIVISSGIVYGCIGFIIRFFSKKWKLTWLNYISTGQLYKYLIGDSVPILRIMLVVFVTAGMIYFVLRFRRFRSVSGILLAIFMFVIFYRTAYIPMNRVNLDLQAQRHETSDIIDVLRTLLAKDLPENEQIFYYVAKDEPDDTGQYRDYIQYWLDDDYLQCLGDEDMNEWRMVPSQALILISCKDQQDLKLFEVLPLELVYENSICNVYRVEK